MKLVFALGNHEPRYNSTRHNVGFIVLDYVTDNYGSTWSEKPKFKAHIAELSLHGEKIVLAKPTTYYNRVGESYHAITSFYDIQPSDVLVVHDDLALTLGTIRTRIGGSDGGSNGLKSLIAHGGEATARLRIGIATPLLERIDPSDYVLGRLTQHELDSLSQCRPRLAEIIDSFITNSLSITTHR